MNKYQGRKIEESGKQQHQTTKPTI